MFSYEHHHGGIILKCHESRTTIFIQPGDDTSQFLDEIENTNENWTDDDVIGQYFGAGLEESSEWYD